MGVKIVPAGQTADHTPLKKHQCDREAAGHPLPGLLDLSFQNKNQRGGSGPHQQDGIDSRSHRKGTRIAQALLEVLDIDAQRRGDKNARNVNSSQHTMEFPEAQMEPIRELERPQQKRTGAGYPMRQQPPLKGLVVLPYWVLRMDQKTLIVKDISRYLLLRFHSENREIRPTMLFAGL